MPRQNGLFVGRRHTTRRRTTRWRRAGRGVPADGDTRPLCLLRATHASCLARHLERCSGEPPGPSGRLSRRRVSRRAAWRCPLRPHTRRRCVWHAWGLPCSLSMLAHLPASLLSLARLSDARSRRHARRRRPAPRRQPLKPHRLHLRPSSQSCLPLALPRRRPPRSPRLRRKRRCAPAPPTAVLRGV